MKRIKVFAATTLLATLLPLAVFAYVSPGRPSGFVNDFTDTLTAVEKNQLEEKLRAFNIQTSNEIAIALVPTIGDDTIENFSNVLFKDWGIGKKNKDNGILLVIAKNDRLMRIEVGYGLEGTLTDLQSRQILDGLLRPAFRENKFYDGLNSAADTIILLLQGDVSLVPAPISKKTPSLSPDFIIPALFFFYLSLTWLVSIMARSHSWWLGGAVGGVGGLAMTFWLGFLYAGVVGFVLLVPFGLWFDFIISRAYQRGVKAGHIPWWAGGRGWGGGSGGRGWGGFGGGSSGGGGSSSSW